jgi:signal transduction histidine kinase
MTYIIAATAVLALLIVAGWKSGQKRVQTVRTGPPNARSVPGAGIILDFEKSPADVAASLQVALNRLVPAMQNRRVRADVAVRPGLLVGMSGASLADLLEEFVAAAIHYSQAHRLLVTATGDNGQVTICLADDAPDADLDKRAGIVRNLAEKITSRGGTLDVDVRTREGTTMTLRFPAAHGEATETPATRVVAPQPTRSLSRTTVAARA